MKSILVIFSIFFALGSVAQTKKLEIGLFVGESTGLMLNKPISNNLSLQFDFGINELFIDYKFIDKYKPQRVNQKYEGIYNTTFNLVYQTPISKESQFKIRGGLGAQVRMVSNYKFNFNPILYLNLGGSSTPVKPFTLDLYLGVNYFVGLSYKINNSFNTFIDFGGYTELFYSFPWTNPQFKLGLKYQFK